MTLLSHEITISFHFVGSFTARLLICTETFRKSQGEASTDFPNLPEALLSLNDISTLQKCLDQMTPVTVYLLHQKYGLAVWHCIELTQEF